MKTFLLGLIVCFLQFCYGQLKDCFSMDGETASIDFPCDPTAEVSACCTAGSRCITSLYCVGPLPAGQWRIGSCTNRSFNDNACPFPLLDSSNGPINYMDFSYAKNTTICQDGTVCPNPRNETCCNSGAGKKEIVFHYINPLPTDVKDLSSFYSLAGYSLPSSTTSSSSAAVSTSSTLTGSTINGVLTSAASALRTGSLQSTPSVNPTPIPTSAGLSNSAKAGIGTSIGLGIALIVCLAIIIFLCRHRYRNAAGDLWHLSSNEESHHWPVRAEEVHGQSAHAEMNGSGRRPSEMNGVSIPAELMARNNGQGREI